MDPIEICVVLSDATRIAIVKQLQRASEPVSLQETVKDYPQHYSVMTRHIGRLVKCGLIKRTKLGSSVFLRCNAELIEQFSCWLRDPQASLFK